MTTIFPNDFDPFVLAEKQAELKALRTAIEQFEAARGEIAPQNLEAFNAILYDLKQQFFETGQSIGLIFEST